MVRGIVGTSVSLSFRKRKTGELVKCEARRSSSTPPPDRPRPDREEAGPRVVQVMSTGVSSAGRRGGVHAAMWGALLRSNGGEGGFLGCPAASAGSFLLLCSAVGGAAGGRCWGEMKGACVGKMDGDGSTVGMSLQEAQQEYAKGRRRKNAGIVIRCADLLPLPSPSAVLH
jgi:hypothetical protein